MYRERESEVTQSGLAGWDIVAAYARILAKATEILFDKIMSDGLILIGYKDV
jgi:hypothetical protein